MIDKQYIVEIDGRPAVKYAGLLKEAHADLKSIRVTVIQAPSSANGELAVCQADIIFKDQLWTEVGDASPATGGRVRGALVRLAATRAKARALRDALGLDLLAVEEMPLADPPQDSPAKMPVAAQKQAVAARERPDPVSRSSIQEIQAYGVQLAYSDKTLKERISQGIGRRIWYLRDLTQSEADTMLRQLSRNVAERQVGAEESA